MTLYHDTISQQAKPPPPHRLILYDNFLTQSDKYRSGALMSVNSLNLCVLAWLRWWGVVIKHFL